MEVGFGKNLSEIIGFYRNLSEKVAARNGQMGEPRMDTRRIDARHRHGMPDNGQNTSRQYMRRIKTMESGRWMSEQTI